MATSAPNPHSKLSDEDKLEEAENLKRLGNEKFKEKLYKQAVGKYHRALLYLKGIGQATDIGQFMGLTGGPTRPNVPSHLQPRLTQLQVDCYNNLAACLLQEDSPNYRKVVTYCDHALTHSPSSAKSLYRKGVAYYHLRDFDKAHSYLMCAKDQNGMKKDPSVDKYLALCDKEMAKEDERMKAVYKGMFK